MNNQDIYQLLVKHDERLKNIYSSLGRIEKHLDKLNGKVADHDTAITKLQTVGAVAVISIPIIVNVIMRRV